MTTESSAPITTSGADTARLRLRFLETLAKKASETFGWLREAQDELSTFGSLWNPPIEVDGCMVLPGFAEANPARAEARRLARDWGKEFNLNDDWLVGTAVETLATWDGYRALGRESRVGRFAPALDILVQAGLVNDAPAVTGGVSDGSGVTADYRRLPLDPNLARRGLLEPYHPGFPYIPAPSWASLFDGVACLDPATEPDPSVAAWFDAQEGFWFDPTLESFDEALDRLTDVFKSCWDAVLAETPADLQPLMVEPVTGKAFVWLIQYQVSRMTDEEIEEADGHFSERTIRRQVPDLVKRIDLTLRKSSRGRPPKQPLS